MNNDVSAFKNDAKLVDFCQNYERNGTKIAFLIFFGEERLAISEKFPIFALSM